LAAREGAAAVEKGLPMIASFRKFALACAGALSIAALSGSAQAQVLRSYSIGQWTIQANAQNGAFVIARQPAIMAATPAFCSC